MDGLIAFVRANVLCVRDGVWREVVLASWLYELRRWRCHLRGHRWGPERRDYEDAGYPLHVETWQDCVRKGCCAVREVWSVYGEPRGTLG